MEPRVLLSTGPDVTPAPISATWNVAGKTGTPPAPAIGSPVGSISGPAYTLSLPGVSGVIRIESFAWGVSAPKPKTGQIGEASVGKPAPQSLSLTAAASVASPQLFYDASARGPLKSVSLTAVDATGKPYATWKLGTVVVTSYSNLNGTDHFALMFQSIVGTSHQSNPVPGQPPSAVFGWNFATSEPIGAPTAAKEFAPNAPPPVSLTLSNGTNAVVSGFTFGGATASSTSAATPGGSVRPSFGPLTVSVPFGNSWSNFLSDTLTGQKMNSMTLVDRNNQGNIIGEWTLTNALVTSAQVSGSSGATPEETYTIHYQGVTETTQSGNPGGGTVSTTWNTVNDTGTAPSSATAITAVLHQPPYLLSLSGVTGVIPIESFTWGATGGTPATIPGEAHRPATAEDFTFTTGISGVSPQLLYDAASGRYLATAELLLSNAAGTGYASWALGHVRVVSYQDANGTDQFSLQFDTLTESHSGTNPVTSKRVNISAGWNFRINQGTSTGVLAPAFNPSTPPAITLTLGNGANAVVSSFTFGGVTRPASADTATGAVKPSFAPLTVVVANGNSSPAFLVSMLSGQLLKTVTLTERNENGTVAATWVLANAVIKSESLSGADGNVPGEVYTLQYMSVTETTPAAGGNPVQNSGGGAGAGNASPVSASWNLAEDKGTSDLKNATGVPLASVLNPEFTLSLKGISGVVPINAYSWTTTLAPTAAGPVIPGESTNPAVRQTPTGQVLTVAAPISAVSPWLFYNTAAGTLISSVVLNAYNARGTIDTEWTMSNVHVTSYRNADGTDQFTLHFSSIVETHKGTNPVTAQPVTSSAGWDFAARRPAATKGAAAPEPAFDPSAPPPLSLTLSNGTSAVVTGFSFGGPAIASTTSSGSITGSSKTTFGPLVVTALLGNGSPNLLSEFLGGHEIADVVLVDRDAQGHILASWKLTGATLTSDSISGDAGTPPTETYTFKYATVTVSTSATGSETAK
jgi:type VI protein secretion system component Hcp